MAIRQKGRKDYTTMQGKNVDMDLLRKTNELTPAVGNARVNARGDELGPGGQIVRKREKFKDYVQRIMPVAEEPALADLQLLEAPQHNRLLRKLLQVAQRKKKQQLYANAAD